MRETDNFQPIREEKGLHGYPWCDLMENLLMCNLIHLGTLPKQNVNVIQHPRRLQWPSKLSGSFFHLTYQKSFIFLLFFSGLYPVKQPNAILYSVYAYADREVSRSPCPNAYIKLKNEHNAAWINRMGH